MAEKRFENYKVGDKDSTGCIMEMIYAANENYIVYAIAETHEVYFDYDPDFWKALESSKEYKKNGAEVWRSFAFVESRTGSPYLREKYAPQIASAYIRALDGDMVIAAEILKKIESSIVNYKYTLGRFYYLLGAFAMIPLLVIGCLVVRTFEQKLDSNFIAFFYVMTWSGFGGFVSVFLKIRKLNIDIEMGVWTNVIMGFSRFLIAVFSGFILVALVKSNLVLPKLGDTSNIYFLLSIGALAGFLENFVPSLLLSVSQGKEEKEKEKKEVKAADEGDNGNT